LPPLPCARLPSSGTVRIVPSWKTNVTAANLAAHARKRPVARGRAADHGAGHVGNVDAVGGQVVRADQHLEGYGSLTVPSIGTRPISAVIAIEPISVEFDGTV
jgi:hypothetical protein